jgi:hypothetical protein
MSQLKAVFVRTAGRGQGDGQEQRVELYPGTTAEDLLKKIDAGPEFRLSYNGTFFKPSDSLDSVPEGAKLAASIDPQVG